MFGDVVQRVLPNIHRTDAIASIPTTFFVATIVAWISWRVWAFGIKPTLQPREPKEVPYWIPGHAVSFFKDTEGTFTRARAYFGNARAPFGLTVAGQRLYIITSPDDVTAIYKNTKTLTFDEYVRDMMVSIGASSDGVEKMWQSSNRLHKTLAHAGEDFYRQQLLPGDRLDVLWRNVQDYISISLTWENLSGIEQEKNAKIHSLTQWTRDVLLKSVTTAFYGERLLDMDEAFLQNFVLFDDESWKLNYKFPRSLSKDMYAAKDRMIMTLEAYFKLPKDKRPGGSWLVQTLETEMRQAGINEYDTAAMLTSLSWVILSNAYKLCFWMMAYLLHDMSLYSTVHTEVSIVVNAGLPGLETRLEDCPRFMALYNEILRLTTASASIRTVESATDLGNLTLRAGGKVLLPFRQLHFNEEVFGTNAQHMDAERFLRNKDLSKSSSFRPFGGGITYCPGRYVARREVLVFIALAICRFKLSLANTKASFPKLDARKPCLGIMTPLKGEDVLVRIENEDPSIT